MCTRFPLLLALLLLAVLPSRAQVRLTTPTTQEVSALRQMVDRQPDREESHVLLVNALIQSGDLEGAAASAGIGLQRVPMSAALTALKGEALLGLGQLEPALDAFRTARTLPASAAVRDEALMQREEQITLTLAQQTFESGSFGQAARWYGAALRLRPDNADLAFNQALALLRAGQPDDALHAADAALSRWPTRSDVLRLKGSILLERQDADGLVEVYRALYQPSPTVENGIPYGQLLLAAGRYEEASEVFESLLDRFPDRADLYDALDRLNVEQSYPDRALAVRRIQRARDPSNPEVMLRIAALLRQIGLPADARAALDTVVVLSGDALDIAIARAATYADESNWLRRQQTCWNGSI